MFVKVIWRASLIWNYFFHQVLITKLRSKQTAETRQYRKASKALLVLIPLFGLTYLIVLVPPTSDGLEKRIFEIARAVLLSTQVSLMRLERLILVINLFCSIKQGFSVALFYCFLNSEVRRALKNYINRWRDENNIRRSRKTQSNRR